MIDLEFYGGVNEIGGNKIKLNLDSTALLLDFGKSFSQEKMFFNGFMKPRKGNGLDDYFKLGLLPKIPGIYREDYLRHKWPDCVEERAVDGLLLSHAHADHAEYITFLRKDIPIYMSTMSRIIFQVMEKTGSGTQEVVLPKPTFQFTTKGNEAEESNEKITSRVRELKSRRFEKIKDNVKVKLLPVDHSLPGAAAYLIKGDADKVIYTGDLRFHGRKKKCSDMFVDESKKFVKKAKKFSPSIMICEGTRIDSEIEHKLDTCTRCGQLISMKTKEFKHKKFKNEEDIQNAANDLIERCDGLAIVNFPIRDLDRLMTFSKIAEDTGRTLLINLKQACMLDMIEKEKSIETDYPKLNDEHIGIYIPRKADGGYISDTYALFDDGWKNYEKEKGVKDYRIWEREFLDNQNAVTSVDIRGNEKKYILRLDNWSFIQLAEINLENAIYIHSITDPFDEGMEFDKQITKNWMDYFNIPFYDSFHVSGHASGPELLEMIRTIHPDILYPIHTEHVEMFDVLAEDGIKVIHPKLKV